MTTSWLQTTGAVLMSLGPGLVWFYYLHRLLARGRQPLGRMLAVCGFGALSTLGVSGTSRLLPPLVEAGGPPLESLLYFVVWVGLCEESWKLLAVHLAIRRRFEEPLDGLVYAGVAALGFATAENAVYVLRLDDPAVLLQRWILSTFGHVLMAQFWGYALGLTRSGPPSGKGLARVLQGLVLSAVVHGLYDWLLIQDRLLWAILLLAGSWKLFVTRARQILRTSASGQAPARAVRECPSCRGLVRRDARCCTACGRPLPPQAPAFCPRCLGPVAQQTSCPTCGTPLRA